MLDSLINFLMLIFAVPLSYLVQLILSLIPDINFLSDKHTVFNSAFVWFFNTAYSLDPILPYSVFISIITIISTFYAILFTFRLVSWVIRKIPFIGIS